MTRREFRPITVVPVGDFGLTVAKYLQGGTLDIDVLVAPLGQCHEVLIQDPSAIAVLISWRPTIAIADALDERSHATGAPFLSLTLNDTAMFMGPIVLPGISCCWRCWASRGIQADLLGEYQSKSDYYAAHPADGPRGYLHSLALLGAAQLCRALDSIHTSVATPGEVIRTDLFARKINRTNSLGFDNCNRCGLHRPIKSRSFVDLRRALRTL